MSRFCLDTRSQGAIAAAGTDLPTVLAALHGDGPKTRRHLGDGSLQLSAATPGGRWLGRRSSRPTRTTSGC
jgi:hypothetical protein